MFIIIKICNTIKPIPITTYHIFFKNKTSIKADDLLNYYKEKYISINEIIKEKNNDIIIEDN